MQMCMTVEQFVRWTLMAPVEIEIVNPIHIILHASAGDAHWFRLGQAFCHLVGQGI